MLSIERLPGFSGDYHVVVEHSEPKGWFRPERRWVQHYRGSDILWKRYPQGDDIDLLGKLAEGLETYVQQYEWSKEHQ